MNIEERVRDHFNEMRKGAPVPAQYRIHPEDFEAMVRRLNAKVTQGESGAVYATLIIEEEAILISPCSYQWPGRFTWTDQAREQAAQQEHHLADPSANPAVLFTGKLRVYFNRHGAAPLVWCVATDHWELAVANIDISAPVATVYRAKATPDDDDGKPSAWLEMHGTLTVVGGVAHVTRGG